MKKSILIIEDENTLANILSEELARIGYSTSTAANGEEGLAVALKQHPDLILLDLMMPKMDGMTVLQKLREDDWGKTASVMILTNLSEMNKISEAMANHVMHYLVKSDWDIDEITKKIQQVLQDGNTHLAKK